MQRIKNAAEAAKIDLTLIPNVVIELPYIEQLKGKPVDLRIPLTREQLNALTADLVDRTFELCDRVLGRRASTARRSTRSSWWADRAACRWCSSRSPPTSASRRARACTPTSAWPWAPRSSPTAWTTSTR